MKLNVSNGHLELIFLHHFARYKREFVISLPLYPCLTVQVALVIRGFGIRGF